jgi:hypothetical protein
MVKGGFDDGKRGDEIFKKLSPCSTQFVKASLMQLLSKEVAFEFHLSTKVSREKSFPSVFDDSVASA